MRKVSRSHFLHTLDLVVSIVSKREKKKKRTAYNKVIYKMYGKYLEKVNHLIISNKLQTIN